MVNEASWWQQGSGQEQVERCLLQRAADPFSAPVVGFVFICWAAGLSASAPDEVRGGCRRVDAACVVCWPLVCNVRWARVGKDSIVLSWRKGPEANRGRQNERRRMARVESAGGGARRTAR